MTTRETITDIVALAGGELTGRVRLQKIVYLLGQLGRVVPAHTVYHHYGPYSSAVDEAVTSAKVFGGLKERTGRRSSDGAPFSIFKLPTARRRRPKLEGLTEAQSRQLVATMTAETSTVIELAATIDWLRRKEGIAEWRGELRRRKGIKASIERVDRALTLLREIGLWDDAPSTVH